MERFLYRSRLPFRVGDVFEWHMRPGAFERLIPPWDSVRILERPPAPAKGTRLVLSMRAGPLRIRWVVEHTLFEPGVQFQDVQQVGPFYWWQHTHRFIPDGEWACWYEDDIEYEVPGGPLGRRLLRGWVRRRLDRTFRYRHARVAHDLGCLRSAAAVAPLTILVTGARGLIGSALTPFLQGGGHEVVPLARTRTAPLVSSPLWNPDAGLIDLSGLSRLDAVVHLAGESIAGWWNKRKKQRIQESRLRSTRLLCEALASRSSPPSTLVIASATGYYGDRGEEVLTEDSAAGEGYLAELAGVWEAACAPARQAGIRVVHLRLGMVLSSRGGALARLLPPFRLGLGGRLGTGRQYWSWIALDDALGIIHYLLTQSTVHGPVNVTSPHPVTNEEFTRTLARVLRRPSCLPVPAWVVRRMLGEMGPALLLASQRVRPARLIELGYPFAFPELEPALGHLLGIAPALPIKD